ncbi:MAG: hypothetical protein ACRDY3_06270 [Acidimicrobiales bacterium]
MPDVLLTKDRLMVVLERLADLLVSAGVRSRIYIVGGAAITLAHGGRDATRDVDASLVPLDAIVQVAEKVARQLELPADWLNAAASAFISPVKDDPSPVPILRRGEVEIDAASVETLLAMKIRASRPSLDGPDIAFLLRTAGLTTVDAAMALYESYYPEDPLPRFASRLIEHALAGTQDET